MIKQYISSDLVLHKYMLVVKPAASILMCTHSMSSYEGNLKLITSYLSDGLLSQYDLLSLFSGITFFSHYKNKMISGSITHPI